MLHVYNSLSPGCILRAGFHLASRTCMIPSVRFRAQLELLCLWAHLMINSPANSSISRVQLMTLTAWSVVLSAKHPLSTAERRASHLGKFVVYIHSFGHTNTNLLDHQNLIPYSVPYCDINEIGVDSCTFFKAFHLETLPGPATSRSITFCIGSKLFREMMGIMGRYGWSIRKYSSS